MRTSPSSPSSGGWGSSRSSTDGREGRAGPRRRLAPLGAAAGLLLALLVGLFVWTGDSIVDLVGRNPPPGGRVRHPPRRVPAGGDPRPRAQPAGAGAHHRVRDGRRRHRPVLARRPAHAQAAPFEHSCDPVRLGARRADLGRRDELDRDPDDRGGTCRGGDAAALAARLPRLRDHRLPRRRGAGRPRPTLAAFAPACRRALARRVHGTAGLLSFLAVEALSEAFAAQAALPNRSAEPGSSSSAWRAATSS